MESNFAINLAYLFFTIRELGSKIPQKSIQRKGIDITNTPSQIFSGNIIFQENCCGHFLLKLMNKKFQIIA